MKGVSSRRPRTHTVPLGGMSRISTSAETESSLAVARGWGRSGREWGTTAEGSFWGAETFWNSMVVAIAHFCDVRKPTESYSFKIGGYYGGWYVFQ